MKNLVIANIGRLLTMKPQKGRSGSLGVIEDAALFIRGGKIHWLGPAKDLPKMRSEVEKIDAKGCVVMPALIDCHTHIVHGGYRAGEFNLRSLGKTYQEIALAGGGIMSTVRSTRSASFEELRKSAMLRLSESLSWGVGTVEIKTGYGLDAETENKLVDVIARLKKDAPQNIIGTSLGAHVVPAEYKDRRSEYLRLVTGQMIPYAAKSGAIFACDVFVDDGAFTKEEAKVVAAAAKKHKLALHLHVDQFCDGRGGELAAELRALSADHLDCTEKNGMQAMAAVGVSAVLLPGASFFAGSGKFPDVREMIRAGVNVAISTDYNPGTNPSLNLWLMATIAVARMGLSCDEALLAITKNAARALGLKNLGVIEEGACADIIILDAENEYFPLYLYGVNCVRNVILNGEIAL